jgi:hypothetical protein
MQDSSNSQPQISSMPQSAIGISGHGKPAGDLSAGKVDDKYEHMLPSAKLQIVHDEHNVVASVTPVIKDMTGAAQTRDNSQEHATGQGPKPQDQERKRAATQQASRVAVGHPHCDRFMKRGNMPIQKQMIENERI